MKKHNLIVLVIILLVVHQSFAQQATSKELEKLIAQFKKPSKDYVLVAAHRGDWRNAPENSIRAVQNCIDMGVDIVEIDVRRTKDGHLIVMHDLYLDRTTTGKGKIENITLDSLKKIYLKSGCGVKTRHRIPTLEELMLSVKGKRILINLDKSWDYIPETYQILKKTGTIKQGIFKGNESVAELRKRIGSLLDSITYMPMVWPANYNIYEPSKTVNSQQLVQDYIKQYNPKAFEIILGKDNSVGTLVISTLKTNKTSVWINTLWPELCADHDDELAVDDPDANWGWVIGKGANIIQTDRPGMLLDYLKKKGLHQ